MCALVISLYFIAFTLFVYLVFGVCYWFLFKRPRNGLKLGTIQKHIITSTFRDSSNSNHSDQPGTSQKKNSDINPDLSINYPTGSLPIPKASRKSSTVKTCSEQKYEDEICLICLDSFQHGDETSHSCNVICQHRYHKSCITQWLVKNNSCPVCRCKYICIPTSSK